MTERERLLAPVERWSFAKKLDLITGVRMRYLTQEEAISAHGLTPDEFIQWWLAYERFGAQGLKVTKHEPRRVA